MENREAGEDTQLALWSRSTTERQLTDVEVSNARATTKEEQSGKGIVFVQPKGCRLLLANTKLV